MPKVGSAGAVALLLLAIGLRLISSETASLSFLVLAIFAILGRARAIQALMLTWLFAMLSSGVAPEATNASATRIVVTAAAALSVFLRSAPLAGGLTVNRLVAGSLLLGTLLLVHSLFVSQLLAVSVLKALSWTLTIATLFSAWAALKPEERMRVEHSVFRGLLVLSLASLPLLTMDVGYIEEPRGFQGILNHPQAFGSMAAVLGAWSAGRFLAQRAASYLNLLVLGLCLVLVVLSESRTAGAAMVIGVAVSLCAIVISWWGSGQRYELRMLRRRVLVIGLVLGGAALLSGPFLAQQIAAYVMKRNDARSLIEAAHLSRGPLVDAMIGNIAKHPLTGIGFGVPSHPSLLEIKRDPVLGMPTSAAIEKGVLPVAVFEEMGILGAAIVLAWLWAVIRRTIRGGLVPLTVLATALLTNLGEATLFSPGGMGLLLLVVISWAATCYRAPDFLRQ